MTHIEKTYTDITLAEDDKFKLESEHNNANLSLIYSKDGIKIVGKLGKKKN